jgi:hypothetical protein
MIFHDATIHLWTDLGMNQDNYKIILILFSVCTLFLGAFVVYYLYKKAYRKLGVSKSSVIEKIKFNHAAFTVMAIIALVMMLGFVGFYGIVRHMHWSTTYQQSRSHRFVEP